MAKKVSKELIIKFAFFLFFLGMGPFFFQLTNAQSLNDRNIHNEEVLKDSFHFLVGGHLYGNSSTYSGYPASTILGSIDTINDSGAHFFISLGDLFMDVKYDLATYNTSFLQKLNIPIFNAVGNHDLSKFGTYQRAFGENTYYSFEQGSSLFLVLDTELDDGSIQAEQLILLEQITQKTYENIFIFSHRPIWAEDDEQLVKIFKGNNRSLFGNNYKKLVEPILNKSTASAIYWFSGSMGGATKAPFFYHKKSEKLHLIQTAIRDDYGDALIKVLINNGKVSIEPFALGLKTYGSIQSHDVNYWLSKDLLENFNIRLLPLYIKQTIFNRSFWFGILFSLSVLFLKRQVWKNENG